MSYTAEQQRAIKWYAERHSLKMQLSAYPMVRFTNDAGSQVTINILNVVGAYHRAYKKPPTQPSGGGVNQEQLSLF